MRSSNTRWTGRSRVCRWCASGVCRKRRLNSEDVLRSSAYYRKECTGRRSMKTSALKECFTASPHIVLKNPCGSARGRARGNGRRARSGNKRPRKSDRAPLPSDEAVGQELDVVSAKTGSDNMHAIDLALSETKPASLVPKACLES